MAGEEFELMRRRAYGLDEDPVISLVDSGRSRCLAVMRERIREATDELMRGMGYKIKDVHPPRLRSDAADGILWGYSLIVERLENLLAKLQNAVVDGVLSAREAVENAHRCVLETVLELRQGARVRGPRNGTLAPLPAAAELGRICAIVERLSGELAALADDCGGESSSGVTFNLYIHTEP